MQNPINRRQFLKATSAAALSAPLLFSPARAAGADTGPNARVSMGVIGTGKQGRGLMQNFLQQPNAQVVAVCDVDTTRREHHRKMVNDFYSAKGNTAYQGCAEYKQFQDLLARK